MEQKLSMGEGSELILRRKTQGRLPACGDAGITQQSSSKTHPSSKICKKVPSAKVDLDRLPTVQTGHPGSKAERGVPFQLKMDR